MHHVGRYLDSKVTALSSCQQVAVKSANVHAIQGQWSRRRSVGCAGEAAEKRPQPQDVRDLNPSLNPPWMLCDGCIAAQSSSWGRLLLRRSHHVIIQIKGPAVGGLGREFCDWKAGSFACIFRKGPTLPSGKSEPTLPVPLDEDTIQYPPCVLP